MSMRARFALAVFAGLLLGAAIVGSSFVYTRAYPTYAGAAGLARLTPNQSTVTSSTTTAYVPAVSSNLTSITGNETASTEASATNANAAEGIFYSSVQNGMLVSHVDSIARQPVFQSALVLLPVLAAVFFGLILYRASGTRAREEAPTE